VLYDQQGAQLDARRGNWSASAWDPDGHGEHSVEAQVHTIEHYFDTAGIALGAFASGRLVGIGVVVPHPSPQDRARSLVGRRRIVGALIEFRWRVRSACQTDLMSTRPLEEVAGKSSADRCDRYGTFPECPLCGDSLHPEHAHFKCRACGWRDSCCD